MRVLWVLVAALSVYAADDKISTALYGDAREIMIYRREMRLKQIPPAPVPPGSGNPNDRFITAKWPKGQKPPELCDDTVFVRRVYLDIIGVIPTIAEADRFLQDTRPDKRARLIDELLARNQDYAAHWTPFWEDAIASSTQDVTGGIANHGKYRNWIFQNFVDNTPYDVMVATLIDPLMPGHLRHPPGNANGKVLRVDYILNESHTETLQSAANVAQVFLGTGMKCASCHNHFLNPEWPQTRFLAFAGMFAPADLEVIRCEKMSGQFVPAKFPFNIPDAPAAMPKDLDSRLHRVAELVTDPTNPRFAKTMVNRLWKRYLGIGLFAPADDFRLNQPASHPELLDWLADDFMRKSYDLKHTIRLILTSRTYQLRYDPKLEDHFDVGKPKAPRYYLSPALRRMTCEQFLDSVRVASTQHLEPDQRVYLNKNSTVLTRALGKPAVRTEVTTSRPDDVAVVQSLELLNGEEYHNLIYSAGILKKLEGRPAAEVADQLYRAVLTRPATAGLPDCPPGDILWALFTSPEFQYIR
jgi:hypothetical protein